MKVYVTCVSLTVNVLLLFEIKRLIVPGTTLCLDWKLILFRFIGKTDIVPLCLTSLAAKSCNTAMVQYI